MKKRFLAALLGAMMVVSITACGLKTPDKTGTNPATTPTEAPAGTTTETPGNGDDTKETITLVYAEVNPLETIVGQTDSAFKQKVEELSNGEIIIDLQASGVLGAENDVLDTMLGGGGTIHMARISAFALTSYGGEKSKLLSVPYTFVNRDHFWNFATSDLAKEFLMEPYENGNGIRGLAYGEEGFRHFFTVKPVNSLEDLKGMKLRVSNDPIMNGMVQGLGASPTVVSFGELYSALQTGVVDGAEQPIANYKANAFPEVAPNIILDGHTLGAIQIVITDDAWESLSDDHKRIIEEASQYASEYNRQISQEAENKVLDELRASGVNIVEVTDIAPWQAATKAIIESSTAANKELYQQILDMK